MSDRFTDSIEPFALATQGWTIEGKIPLVSLERLGALVRSSQSPEGEGASSGSSFEMEGDVEFTLHFDIDEVGAPRVGGNASASLRLQCQRCMKDMEYPISLNVRLGIVPSRKAAENLPDSYDPLVVSDDEISIASILEDELILAMPIVAKHEIENCIQNEARGTENSDDKVGQENLTPPQRENPFAVLSQLKKT
jgi:uncharacterized protein